MECPSNVYLPADIVRQVLLRLPVKILSQFKCVCKEWYTLIESQSFVNEHFVNESNKTRLLVFNPVRNRVIYVDHRRMPGIVIDVMGPVNGIFCVVNNPGGMGLLNPALRQFKPLPFLSCAHLKHLAFGLDPLSGYYKVVSIQINRNFRSNSSIYPPPIVHVYSSGSDSWRLLEDVDILRPLHCAFRSKSNTYLNGVYYWVMQYRNTDYDVLAFDMSSDKFRIIRIPDVIRHGGLGLELKLVVYGDSMVILSFSNSFCHNDKFVDMWVLENDGMWTKISTFGPFGELRTPLGFWKNNEPVLHTDAAFLTLYNIFTHELRFVVREEMFDPARYLARGIYAYKESLVSIKGEGKEDNCKLCNISSGFVMNFFEHLIV